MDVRDLTRYYDEGTQSIAATHEYRGMIPEIVRTGFEAGGSELAGYLIGRYSETLQKTKVPVPLVVGLALKGVGIGLDFMSARSGRQSRLSPIVSGLGSAGMNAFFVLDGVARGHASKNEQFYLGQKNQAGLPAGVKPVDRLWGEPAATAVGEIPQAPADGQWFDEGGLRHFANS